MFCLLALAATGFMALTFTGVLTLPVRLESVDFSVTRRRECEKRTEYRKYKGKGKGHPVTGHECPEGE
jgi:hypothetical protein